MFSAIPFPALEPDVFTLPAFELFGATLGPFPLRWYALAYIAGLLLGWRYMVSLSKDNRLWAAGQKRPDAAQCDDFLFWATLGVIFGGRLGYVIFYKPDMIWTNPGEIAQIWTGGMAFHGGLIGVAAAIFWFARRHGIAVLTLGDIVAACAPIGLFFGRIANFINAELWGRPTDLPWGVIFPTADGRPRHPSQLYEAALEGLVLFALMALVTRRWRGFTRPGFATGVFLAAYGVFRAALENVREPDAHMPEFPLGLTMGMLLSLPMIAIGAALIAAAFAHKPARA